MYVSKPSFAAPSMPLTQMAGLTASNEIDWPQDGFAIGMMPQELPGPSVSAASVLRTRPFRGRLTALT